MVAGGGATAADRAKNRGASNGFSGQTAGRMGEIFGGKVRRREGVRTRPAASQTVAGRRRSGLKKIPATGVKTEQVQQLPAALES